MARVSRELIEGIERVFPEQIGRGAPQIPAKPPAASFINAFDREARPVGATGDGYLQFIDSDVLLPLAMEEDVVLRLERRPGHYVVADQPLVLVWPGDRATAKLISQIRSAFILGSQRTPAKTPSLRSTSWLRSRYGRFPPGSMTHSRQLRVWITSGPHCLAWLNARCRRLIDMTSRISFG